MHCPNCRESNAATTRFCTACGAVLVENAPGGGRRRVLRPWGLRHSAPPTESPAMPDMAKARAAALRANGKAKPRFDVVVVCGLAILGAAGVVAYPFTSSPEMARSDVAEARPVVQEAIVTVPPISSVRETQLASPALLEPPPTAAAVNPKPVAQPPAEPSERRASPPPVELAPVVAASEPAPAPRAEPRAADPIVAPPIDRWQPLPAQLAGCGAVGGLLQRAMCEQGARLAHCEGQWGETPLCPQGRTEYGQ